MAYDPFVDLLHGFAIGSGSVLYQVPGVTGWRAAAVYFGVPWTQHAQSLGLDPTNWQDPATLAEFKSWYAAAEPGDYQWISQATGTNESALVPVPFYFQSPLNSPALASAQLVAAQNVLNAAKTTMGVSAQLLAMMASNLGVTLAQLQAMPGTADGDQLIQYAATQTVWPSLQMAPAAAAPAPAAAASPAPAAPTNDGFFAPAQGIVTNESTAAPSWVTEGEHVASAVGQTVAQLTGGTAKAGALSVSPLLLGALVLLLLLRR